MVVPEKLRKGGREELFKFRVNGNFSAFGLYFAF